jgi:hypothetical protein
MKKNVLLMWTAVNAIGLAVGFVAFVQTVNLIGYGSIEWQPEPPSPTAEMYFALLVAFLVEGAIFGSGQALVLRSLRLPAIPWILATAAGFGLTVIIDWPLLAAEILGRIPGPVEPIIATVGGGSLAGIVQYLVLRRQGIHASKWLTLWIVGLFASQVPIALLFMSLEALGVSLSWPVMVFLSGLMTAGVAALISGNRLLAVISGGQHSHARMASVNEDAV